MTRYLLDTDALIDFSKRREPASSRILSWVDEGETVGVCAIADMHPMANNAAAVRRAIDTTFAPQGRPKARITPPVGAAQTRQRQA